MLQEEETDMWRAMFDGKKGAKGKGGRSTKWVKGKNKPKSTKKGKSSRKTKSKRKSKSTRKTKKSVFFSEPPPPPASYALINKLTFANEMDFFDFVLGGKCQKVPTYVLFSSDELVDKQESLPNDGETPAEDIPEVLTIEEIVERCLVGMEKHHLSKNINYLIIHMNPKQFKNSYACYHPAVRLRALPTLMRWGELPRVEGNECLSEDILTLFFGPEIQRNITSYVEDGKVCPFYQREPSPSKESLKSTLSTKKSAMKTGRKTRKTTRKTKRKTARKTTRKTERKTARKTERKTAKKTERKTERKTDKQTGRKTDKQPAGKTDKQPARKTDKQPARKTDKQPARKTERKTTQKPATKSEKKPPKK